MVYLAYVGYQDITTKSLDATHHNEVKVRCVPQFDLSETRRVIAK
jgi:hypothetical protein